MVWKFPRIVIAQRENLGPYHSKTGLAYVLVRMIVEPLLMVAAMLAGPKQYGILKRSGSEKNGEEPHNPVFKAHT